jgi:hypothetical protein
VERSEAATRRAIRNSTISFLAGFHGITSVTL